MGKKSWGWGKIVIDVPPLDSNPFQDEFLQWMNSPAGERSEEALDTVWPILDTTQVDAKGGKFLWPDGKRLGIEHTVRRIYKAHPELGRQLIEDKVISWLEMGYAPENFSQQQSDDLEQLVDRWIEDHHRRARRRKTT
jgi:hypothetical protein